MKTSAQFHCPACHTNSDEPLCWTKPECGSDSAHLAPEAIESDAHAVGAEPASVFEEMQWEAEEELHRMRGRHLRGARPAY